MAKRFQGSRTWKRWLDKPLNVAPADIDTFKSDVIDLGIVFAIADGAPDSAAIAEYIKKTEDKDTSAVEVANRMKSPLRRAWVNAKLNEWFSSVVGFLYAKLFNDALAGDRIAAKLFLTRFDASYRPTTRKEVFSARADLGNLSGADLKLTLLERLRRLEGLDEGHKPRRIIDQNPETDTEGNREARPGDAGTASPIP